MNKLWATMLTVLMAQATMAQDGIISYDGLIPAVPMPSGPIVQSGNELVFEPTSSCSLDFNHDIPGVAMTDCTCDEIWRLIGIDTETFVLLFPLYERACGPVKLEVRKP